jgi:putative DNA primase/helicase
MSDDAFNEIGMRDAAREYHEDRERERNRKGHHKGDGGSKSTDANGAGKGPLVIDNGNLPKLRDALARSGVLYDRGAPVRIALRGTGEPIAEPLTVHGVVRLAHEVVRPIKNAEPATLPERVAGLYLDMQGEWKLPILKGFSSTPLLTDNGSIRCVNGYDEATGIYCHGMPEVSVPEKPTKDEAKAALLKIRTAFRTFPFADAERRHDAELGVDVVDLDKPIGLDEAGFLAGLLTAICRPSLWLAPGLLLSAPSISGAGSGKGLLVRAIGLIAYDIRVRPFSPGHDRNELDKRLVADVIEGKQMIALDNVNATLLRSNTPTAATGTGWRGRL